ncbi:MULTISPECIES: hypothetical protein [Bacillus amyloliquefaciens group]|uniref:hypothetical protein n=1 Tax=Bacillus amyloliquefaciens group TaxID=1938374 RepID=UPI000C81898C|nr:MULTISPECIES: hypothetical protein [Bacillus amyloliquefaciens group]MEC0384285.1 hypothetical protein [Bacillus velezensis]MEC0403178.1 hypothetical protein [Bacillus velezensis]QMI88287.1 hypothetical protein H1Q60_19595 [Bacillus velezensis]QMT26517.1 hypothetical protein H2N97_09440 [Bacillus velezensis]WJN56523.1 hypothetical protein QTN52_09515 [Bacillus velezensis]
MQAVDLKATKKKISSTKSIDENFTNMAVETYLNSILDIRKIILNAKTQSDLFKAKTEVKALLQDIERVLRGGDALSRTAESNPHYATFIAFMENLKTHISIEFEQFIYKPQL